MRLNKYYEYLHNELYEGDGDVQPFKLRGDIVGVNVIGGYPVLSILWWTPEPSVAGWGRHSQAFSPADSSNPAVYSCGKAKLPLSPKVRKKRSHCPTWDRFVAVCREAGIELTCPRVKRLRPHDREQIGKYLRDEFTFKDFLINGEARVLQQWRDACYDRAVKTFGG